MKSRKGFTLAEVLITLAVIGVVAAMTIPALIGNTQSAELTVGVKKALSALNQSLVMSIAQDSTDAAGYINADAANSQALANYFSQKLNVVKKGTDYFYTADGMQFTFKKQLAAVCGASSATSTNLSGTTECYVTVDVNGDKGPNEQSTTSGGTQVFRDRYNFVILKNSVIAATNATTDVTSAALQR